MMGAIRMVGAATCTCARSAATRCSCGCSGHGPCWSRRHRTAAAGAQDTSRLICSGKVWKGTRGKDIQVETTLGDMLAALNGDALLRGAVQDMTRLMDRALLWLHEQQVVTLGRGLTVFRPAITVHLDPKGGRFTGSTSRPSKSITPNRRSRPM
jgi:hypothetical protein